MFKKGKTDYKAKLEHKLYLARENPEPIFDLSDCGLRQVPSGIYSLCRVFLKEILLLDHNKLTVLSNGGVLKDLSGLRILDLSHNSFTLLPDDISSLSNLRDFYLNNNNIKKLPASIGSLQKLRLLDVSNNNLRNLPTEIGNLNNLQQLNAVGNSGLNHLPPTICNAKRITTLQLDAENFVYPSAEIVGLGTECIMKFICHDNGVPYVSPSSLSPDKEIKESPDETDYHNSGLQEKIWEFEKLKQQKMEEKLKFEKEYEKYQRQELELQAALKANRQKFLTDITEQQIKLENELARIQQKKEEERCKLIQQLQEEEKQADIAITQLLTLMREPWQQLLEQERMEEEKLMAACLKYNENLRKNDVLEAMKTLLEEETNTFKKYDTNREETARSILQEELMSDGRLSDLLRTQCEQQAVLVSQLQMDMELQRIAVGALLERGDARSWTLIQQVHLVETQLAKLTAIEMDRRKLEMDEQINSLRKIYYTDPEDINDLAEKRANLSVLLVDLLEQQGMRRAQLLSTLQNMEQMGQSQEDFWLVQYQRLLDRRPAKMTDIQKNIDPDFAQELLLAGVIHYLPFLAEWVQEAELDLTEEQLIRAGVRNKDDRKKIINAFYKYCALKSGAEKIPEEEVLPSTSVEPTAPALEHSTSISNTECVICMDSECEIIFVPCGHMCCCTKCSTTVSDCPLCRGAIERKIKVLIP